jgi:hypothetical protein
MNAQLELQPTTDNTSQSLLCTSTFETYVELSLPGFESVNMWLWPDTCTIVCLCALKSNVITQTLTLTVNHPGYMDICKLENTMCIHVTSFACVPSLIGWKRTTKPLLQFHKTQRDTKPILVNDIYYCSLHEQPRNTQYPPPEQEIPFSLTILEHPENTPTITIRRF